MTRKPPATVPVLAMTAATASLKASLTDLLDDMALFCADIFDDRTAAALGAARAGVVADFNAQGYRLVGGRADFFDHQRAAVVVYQHGPHIINVFSWAGTERPLKDTTRNGYHLAFWKAGNLEYCAVSDTGWEELLGLTRLLQDLAARDTQP